MSIARRAAARFASVPTVLLGVLVSAGALHGAPPVEATIRLRDVSEAVGIDFRHHHGGTGEKHLPETMGSGVAWLDYDVDGAWDLYFVDSGPLPDPSAVSTAAHGPRRDAPPAASGIGDEGGGNGSPSSARSKGQGGSAAVGASEGGGGNVLYRNRGDGRFDRPAGDAGTADAGYGMGAAVADYDGDGWPDLLVTNFGANALYRNNGDGTYTEVTRAAGLGDRGWGSSATWGDLDADGFADPYVVNYVVYDLTRSLYCGDLEREIRSYCHIDLFDGQADVLYRNRGDGGFTDVADAAGVANAEEGRGLGVVMGDLEGDGGLDIYVANDMARNFLYVNRGGMRFEDRGLDAGVGFSDAGMPQAGMGVDLGDVDGDGRLDIVVTNFAFEPNNLYRLSDTGMYLEDSFTVGLGEPSLRRLGFGVAMVDLDLDGDLDLAVANGHIMDTVERFKDNTTYAQSNQVYLNLRRERISGATGPVEDGTLFRDVSAQVGSAVTRERVSRGLASGDADGDGRPDLAITNSDGPAELLHNASPTGHGGLVLRLRGRRANRDALGARVTVVPHGQGGEAAEARTLEVRGASSYLSQGATDLYVGLGEAPGARVTVRWPGGVTEELGVLRAGALHLAREGRGVVASTPSGPGGYR